ncbi:carbohydrate kinase [Iocasia frigidifontis]|uniref:Tagatose-6-phosphate kinase n=1 Tax=Iocasia fonsfrigidae TaxID=2682810 RepID=A0A8A7KFH3_9FIRM|nr:PfkB family carbohydrate kinase [Iocasia fonsfrigidae]QTL96622.1 carbohydrate kinase [Iocasia fonsfrigidae]
MITTVTLNPAIDREYFVTEHVAKRHEYLYDKKDIRVYPGGKGLLTAIDLKYMGYPDVQNLGFVGGKQGLFFEKMVQKYKITTNYIYTENEIRNNVFIISKNPVTFTHYSDYSYRVTKKDVEDLIKRFKRAIVDSDLIIIAGSIPEGVDFDIYQRMISICNDQDKDVFLQASGETLNQALKEKPKVVSPYFKHTRKILDQEVVEFEDYVKMGYRLLEEGAHSVVIPHHCDRLLFIDGKAYSLTPVDFCLRNWLGAGDAYNAGFYDYIARKGFDFIEANRYGAAAALTVAENRSIFIKDKELIKDNLNRIKIKELEV